MILALSLVINLANADTGATLDPSTVETELMRQGIELQAIKAELAARKACGKASCPPAPVSKPKATAPKPAPKSAIAPKPAPVVAPAPAPDPRIAELERMIADRQAEIVRLNAALNRPIVVNVAAPASPLTDEKKSAKTVVSSAGRAQIGVGETLIAAAPIGSSESWVTEDTALNVRYSWKLPAGKDDKGNPFWFALDGSAGYSFLDRGSAVQVMPELVVTVGSSTDVFVGAGARGVCNDVFGGSLCSRTRVGGQAAIGFDQHLVGPLGVQGKVLVGYEVDDDRIAGPGGRLYGGASLQFFVGGVGEITSSAPK